MSLGAMNNQSHSTNRELLMLLERELPRERAAEIADHLTGCHECRGQLARLESLLGGIRDAREQALDRMLPPRAPARARLADGIAQARQSSRILGAGTLWQSSFALAIAVVAVLSVAYTFMEHYPDLKPPQGYRAASVFAPDPQLTPGLTNHSSRADLCASDSVPVAAPVDRQVALDIFRSHGVSDPSPMAYELDHLVPPELGGVTAVRNLWPQPYDARPWNASAKDALEDRLLHLICQGQVPLATAQAEIADDWVAAYKKYFRTAEPLVEHAAFLKDEPWR